MNDFQTNTVPPGIYTVWVEGESGNPYYQQRRVAVPARIQKDANGDGDYNDAGDVKTTRDFSLINSILDGSSTTLGALDLDADLRQHHELHPRRAGTAARCRSAGTPPRFTDCSMDPALARLGIDRVQRVVGDADHRHRRPVHADDQHDRAGAGLLHVHAPRAGHERRRAAGHPPRSWSASPSRPRPAAASTSTSSASRCSRSTPSPRTTSSAMPSRASTPIPTTRHCGGHSAPVSCPGPDQPPSR